MKKYLQKNLSVLLALLMVFSMFVITPEMFTKAEAMSAGTYYYKVTFEVTDDMDNLQMKWSLTGKTNNGTGSESSITSGGWTSDKDVGTETYTLMEGTTAAGVFPIRVVITDNNGAKYYLSRTVGAFVHLYVGSSVDNLKELALKGTNVSSSGVKGFEVGSTNGWFSLETKAWGSSNKFNAKYEVSSSDAYPKATNNTWEDEAVSKKVPSSTTNVKVEGTKAVKSVTDQYGVAWGATQPQFIITGSETGTSNLGTNYFTAPANSSDKVTFEIKNGAADYLNGEVSKLVYVRERVETKPSSGSYIYADQKMTMTLSNYDVKVNYDLNAYKPDGTTRDPNAKFGTPDDPVGSMDPETLTWGTRVTAAPENAFRTGYTFNGMYSAKTGGTKMTEDETGKINQIIKPGAGIIEVTYYAQWSAIDNYIEFYNSDGQLIEEKSGKFDKAISTAGKPSNPAYPGKTSAVSGTYTFAGWMVWEAPTHPDWTGTLLSTHESALLDTPDATPMKVIATYTLSGASAKQYTATFKLPSGSNHSTNKKDYWTEINMPSDAGEATLITAANGFEPDQYDYTFVGWTTETPKNGKWIDIENQYKEYNPGAAYRLKTDVTFYPCYSKAIKQCEITKHYYILNEAGAPVKNDDGEKIEKSLETQLGAKYDLGVPNPNSFNYGGYSYNFVGWTKSDSTVTYGTGTAEILYKDAKAEITVSGDCSYWAVYEKTEIKYNASYYNGSKMLKKYDELSRYVSDGVLKEYTIAEQYDGEEPERAREGQTGYTFVGWTETLAKAINPEAGDLVTSYTLGEQSKIFYAAFNTFDYYTVTFKDDKGNQLQSSSDYVAGDTIAYTSTAPEETDYSLIPIVKNRTEGAQYQYTFKGWQSSVGDENTIMLTDEDGNAVTVEGKNVMYALAPGEGNNITVSGNRTYTAVFYKETREYNISLYPIGTNLNKAKVNEDGYSCYTDEDGNKYFVLGSKIYVKQEGEYSEYTGELTVAQLKIVKPDAIKVLSIKFGEHILDKVEQLYEYSSDAPTDIAEKDVKVRNSYVCKINSQELKVVPYGESEEKAIPYGTDQYNYMFNGWNPTINAEKTVTGDESFVATYSTKNVIYNVHWYTPTSCAAAEPYNPLGYSEQTTTYTYKRAIATPAKTPTVSAPTTVANYSWNFLGWYVCDEDKNIKTDDEGNELKFTRGTLTDPGDNHNRDFYYVAKFGFVKNEYTVKLYDYDGEYYDSYSATYGSPVYIKNLTRSYDDDYHYVLSSFEDMNNPANTFTVDDADKTAFTVTGNIELKAVYTAVGHTYPDESVVHTTLPNYKDDGVDTWYCQCGHSITTTVPKLIDVNPPEGKIAIRSYNWSDETGKPEKAYVKSDSLIAIMASDWGENDKDENPVKGEGEGIKSIVYTWSNGAAGGKEEYPQFEKPTVNLDIQIPTGSAFTNGMALTAVITDWTGKTYTVKTGGLYTDAQKPVVEIEAGCEGFRFGVIEDNLSSVTATLDGEEFDLTPYKISDADLDAYNATLEEGTPKYAAIYIGEKTDTTVIPEGKYVIKATDSAGNSDSKLFTVTNQHKWNDGKITTDATCTEDGLKVYTCSACGAQKEETLLHTGHKWNGQKAEEYTIYIYDDGEEKTAYSLDGEKFFSDLNGINEIEVTDASPVAKTVKTSGGDEYKVYTYTDGEETKTAYSLDGETFYDSVGADKTALEITEATPVYVTAAGYSGKLEYTTDKEPTCTEKGAKSYYCAVCGEMMADSTVEIDAKGHEEVVKEQKATCAADGYKLTTCKNCDLYEFIDKNTDPAYAQLTHEVKTDADGADEDGFIVEKEATCTAEGSKYQLCKLCGEKINKTSIGKIAHSFEEITPNKDVEGYYCEAVPFEGATKATYHLYKCEECGYSYEFNKAAKQHDYEETEPTPATCVDDEILNSECKACGRTKAEVQRLTALDHDWETDYTIDVVPTCFTNGSKSIHCSRCDERKNVTVITAPGKHDLQLVEEESYAATCVKDGLEVWVCANENCTLKGYRKQTDTDETEDIKAEADDEYTVAVYTQHREEKVLPKEDSEHTWNDGVITKEASCTEKGIKTYTCTDEDCKTLKGYRKEADGDDTDDLKAAAEGEYTVAVYVPTTYEEEIPMLKHEAGEEVIEHKEATCKTLEKTVYKCKNCEDGRVTVYGESYKEHTKGALVKTITAASCGVKGEGYYNCSVCGQTIKSEIPAIEEHSYKERITVPATCTSIGEKELTCTICGDVKPEEIPALGHDWDGQTAVEYKVYTAEVSSEEKTVYSLDGEKFFSDVNGLNEVEVTDAVPTGETVPGYSGGTYTVDTEPTCTEKGAKSIHCTRCDAVEEGSGKEIADLGGHDIITLPAEEATCTKAGKTEGKKCSRCDYVEVEQKATEKAPHTKGERIKLLTEATCVAKGSAIFICTVCKDTYTGEIEINPDAHKLSAWSDWETVTKATCMQDGVEKSTQTCLNDGCTYENEKTRPIPAPGHDFVEVSRDEPVVEGNKTTVKVHYKCSNCEETKTEDVVTVLYTVSTGEEPIELVNNEKLTEEKIVESLGEIPTKDAREDKTVEAYSADGVTFYDGTGEDKAEINVTSATPVNKTVEGADGTVYTEYTYTDGGENKTAYSADGVVFYDTTDEGKVVVTVTDATPVNEMVIGADSAVYTKYNCFIEGEDGAYVVVWKLDGEEVTLPATVSSDCTLTYDFKFIPNTYKVTFLNGEGKVISEKSYVRGEEVTVPDDQYVVGYKFLGWNDGETNYKPDEVPAVTKSVTYTPWLDSNDNYAKLYITFKNDSGTSTLYTAVLEHRKGDPVSFDLPTDLTEPTKNNNTVYHYSFDAWLDKNGEKVTFPVELTDNTTFKASFISERHDTVDNMAVTSVEQAKCTTPEVTKYKCNKCGYEWTAYTKPATDHSWKEISRIIDGDITIINYSCEKCTDVYSRTVSTESQADIIVVKVTDGSAPLSGVNVSIKGNSKSYSGVTNESGCAYFDKGSMEDGKYQVNVTKDNYSSASGQLEIKNGTGVFKATLTKQQCHCGCHRSGFFGDFKRFFNKIFRLFNKSYTCCSCGECEKIY